MIRNLILAITTALLLVLAAAWLVGSAAFFDEQPAAEPVASIKSPNRSPQVQAPSRGNAERTLLFGDLHVHTSYSIDAALTDTPASKATPYTTPADACDFARYCAALDFWSINDHAEGLTPWQWQATGQALRNCQAATDAHNPDMVSFLGWEWTQGSPEGQPGNHYGHKNVIFRELTTERTPSRPIASGESNTFRQLALQPVLLRGLAWMAMSGLQLEEYQSLASHVQTLAEMAPCPAGDVRELPGGCYESAETPAQLFAKLDQWGFDALVIPHGMAWGNTNPPGADFAVQIEQHNTKYQRLLEVYSGHGNSEVFRDIAQPLRNADICPAPANGYVPCCWRAGEIISARCLATGSNSTDCEQRAATTRQMYLDNMGVHSQFSRARDVVTDTHPNDWGSCDQLVGEFQPSYYYQPLQSAQYSLTLGGTGKRFRPGFIASTDIHSARAGATYKEQQRIYFTDVKEKASAPTIPDPARPGMAQPVPPSPWSPFPDSEDLSNAFYYSGGLVALYSEGRSRDAIWDALYRREVYGTSGPRIGLMFEMMATDGNWYPMGTERQTIANPRFRVRGTGSLKQRPGCPESVSLALGADRMQTLCRGECFYPDDDAWSVTRLELVRILPQQQGDTSTAALIEDPWMTYECPPESRTCEAEFVDNSFSELQREALYYARVIQEATPAIQGDPLR